MTWIIPLAWFVAGLGTLVAGHYVGQRFVRLVYPQAAAMQLDPAEFGLAPECFEVTARDGVVIRGWVFEPAGSPCGIAVICHGRYLDMSRHLPQIRSIVEGDATVVAFDFRGCGRSEAPKRWLFNSLWEPLWDLHAVLDFVERRYARSPEVIERLAMVGFSFGGNMALAYAGRYGRSYAALVLDSTPLVRWETMLVEILRRERSHSRLAPLRALGDVVIVRLAVWWTRSDALYRLACRSTRQLKHTSVLSIVGTKDNFFDVESACAFIERYFGPEAEVWRVPRGRHLTNHLVAPVTYPQRVNAVLSQAFARRCVLDRPEDEP